jgi:predicted PurR-regulated permease PerM
MQSQVVPTQEQGWFTRERMMTLALIAATAFVCVVCFLLVLPFLPALTWSVALAVLARPVHRRIAAKVPWRGTAAILAVVFVVVVILTPLALLLWAVASQAGEAVALVQGKSGQELRQGLVQAVPQIEPTLNWFEAHVDLAGEIDRILNHLGGGLLSVATGVIAVATQVLVTLFLLFYFFRDRDSMLHGVRSYLPLTEREIDVAVRRVKDTVHATVFGSLVVAAVQGTLAGLMFWILGMPTPVLWGTVTALVALVPFLGSFVVWVPASVLLALQGHWTKAAILMGWGITAVGTIDNILYPIIVGTRLRLNTPTALLAFLGGLAVFGISGVILGPVVVAVTLALLDIWKLRTWRGEPAEAVMKKELKEDEKDEIKRAAAQTAAAGANS